MTTHIAFSDFNALRDRCQVGSLRVVTDDPGYEDGAVVPVGDWEPIDADTAHRLHPGPDTPDSALVELFAPPVDTPQVGGALPAQIALSRRDFLEQVTGAQFLGLPRPTPEGLLTSTVSDLGTGLRIGLHLDNWDRLPYATRHRARRRLCLNLGPGVRYLLVGDLDVRAIGAHFGAEADEHPEIGVVRRYVREGNPLRCLRLRLDPGHGYLAPTDLLPHDGSTHQQPRPTTTSMWLGRWKQQTFGTVV